MSGGRIIRPDQVLQPGQSEALAGGGVYGTPSELNPFVTREYLRRAQQVEVCTHGKGDFTKVKDAVDAITDASATKPYVVLVRPGLYAESPFSLKPYISIMGMGGFYSVILQTIDNNNHFITGAGASELWGVALDGPTGTGYAAVYYSSTGYTPMKIINSTIRKGYYGIWAHHATTRVRVHVIHSGNWYAGSAINKFIYTTGFGNITVMDSAIMSGPPGAILTAVEANSADSEITLDNVAIRNGGCVAVDCHAGLVRCKSLSVSEASVAFEANNGGMIHCSGGEVGAAVPTHFRLLDSASMIEFTGKADKNKLDNSGGGTFIASFGDETPGEEGQVILGELWLGPTASTSIPLRSYSLAAFDTGWVSGGAVTKTINARELNIAAGTGYVNNGTSVQKVSWAETQLTLSAGTIGYISVDISGTVSFSVMEPNYATTIILAAAGADASTIVGVADHRIPIKQLTPRLEEYIEEVIGPICGHGLIATKHATPSLEVNVDSGAYFRGNQEFDITGSSPVTFTRIYRNGSGGFVFVPNQTTADADYYDNGSGTLAAVPVGLFTRDVLYVNKTPDGEDFYYVYGQETYNSQMLAETGNNPVPLEFLNKYGMRVCAIVVEQGSTDIAAIADQRPFLGQFASGSTAVTDHGGLSGLIDDDHSQYFNQVRGDARYALGADLSSHAGLTAAHGASGAVVGTTNTQVISNKTLNETDSIRMDVTAGEPTYALGTIFWDAPNQTVGIHTSPDTTVQVGQETVALCYNHEAFQINNGQIVRLSGAQGDRPAIHLADASTESESYALGMATQDIAAGAVGFVTIRGVVRGLDTQAYTEGALLYLSETPGALTMTKPAPPAHSCIVGRALNSKSNGSFFINVSVGHEIDELHDVLIGTKADNDLIVYEQATGLWKNKQLPAHAHAGYEPANANIQTHIASTSNPHSTTYTQVGAAPASHTHPPIIINPASVTVDSGTLISGSVTDLDDLNAVSVQVQEATGVGPMRVRVGFTSVPDEINNLFIRANYDGGASHNVAIQIYNYDTTLWETLVQMSLSPTLLFYSLPIYNGAAYVDGSGNAEIRFEHLQSGVASHNIYIDYAVLRVASEGASGGVTDHGALTGLGDDDHPQYHNDTRGDLRYSQLGHGHSGAYEPAGAVSTHEALTTGVHGVGAGTIAKTADITAAAVGNTIAQWNADQIQGKAIAAPVAGDDLKHIRYNHSSGTFEYFMPAGGGDVVGPASAVSGNFPSFSGTSGKIIQDSGSNAASFATAGHTHPATGMTVVNKINDQTKTANTTIANDTDLQFALAANTRYIFRMKVFYDTTAAADFKWRHTGGVATTSLVRIKRSWIVPGGSALAGILVDTAFSAADLAIVTNAANGGYIEAEGIIVTTGTPGTFAFQWAQNTSDAGNTIVRGGSYIEWMIVA